MAEKSTTRTRRRRKKAATAGIVLPVPPTGHERSLSESTIGDWGQRLPIGVYSGGELHRQFSMRRYTMGVEKELDEVSRPKKGRAPRVSLHVAKILSRMLTSCGLHGDFQDLPEEERISFLTGMFVGDVMYMWIWLRIEALGEIYKFSLECPACQHKWDWNADLNRTDVKVCEGPDDLGVHHTMRHGLEIRDETVTEIIVHPPRWSCYFHAQGNGGRHIGQGSVKEAMLASSIAPIGGYPVAHSQLEEMSKFDIEMLMGVVDEGPGPDLVVEVECPECEMESKSHLNWDWSFFFSRASL